MLRKWRFPIVWATVGLLAIVAVGCSSDDDDKGTGTPLTPEEQAELLEAFGLDADSAGATLMPIFASGLAVDSWDGFSCEDLGLPIGPLGKIGATGPLNLITDQLEAVAGSGTGGRRINELIEGLLATAAANSEPDCGYDQSKGMWIVEIDTAVTVEGDGNRLVLEMEMHDTVGYSTTVGGKQEQPNTNTSKFTHGTALDLHLEITKVADPEDPSTLDGKLDLVLTSHQEVTGLNTPVVTLNGNSIVAGDVDLAGKVPDTSGALVKIDIDGTLGLTSHSDDVLVPKPQYDWEDPCPTSGTMGTDVTVDFKLAVGNERHTAKGEWTLNIEFVGEGMATVTVETGGYQDVQTAQVCTPPTF